MFGKYMRGPGVLTPIHLVWGVVLSLTHLVVLFDLFRDHSEPFLSVRLPVSVTDYAFLLALVGACGATVSLGWRCACALSRADEGVTRGTRVPLVLMLLAQIAGAAGLSLRSDPVPSREHTVFLVVMMLPCVATHLGFVVAAAVVEAESRGHTPGQGLLTLAHNVGGFGGIALARRLFPDSPALAKFRPEFPLIGFAAVALGFALLMITYALPLKLLRMVEPPFRAIAPGDDNPLPELVNPERGGGPGVPQFGGAPPANHFPGMPPGFTSPFK